MPLIQSFSSDSARNFGFECSVGKTISDSFNRVGNNTLGSASSGQTWNVLSGNWNTSNGSFNNLTGYADPSSIYNYPIAAISAGTSHVKNAYFVPSVGMGAAFWVKDANNWWAVALDATSYTTTTTCCTSTYNSCASCTGDGSPPNCSTGPCSGQPGYPTYPYTTTQNQTACDQPAYVLANNCNGTGHWSGTCFTCSQQVTFYDPDNCGGSCVGGYSTSCYTCYVPANNTMLAIYSCVNGTVTLQSYTHFGSTGFYTPQYIQFSTTGPNISVTAYSDTARTSVMQTLSYSASSPTYGNSVGIVSIASASSAPSLGNQIGNFYVQTI